MAIIMVTIFDVLFEGSQIKGHEYMGRKGVAYILYVLKKKQEYLASVEKLPQAIPAIQ